ncbi:MAG: L-threonylcarbamoyladenylate synthase [Cyanobacteriota bacterium]|nr:L-threonylcarbamoyladenylate synthase [Cyanobacteriota bacterium]
MLATQILDPTPTGIAEAARLLREGNLVAIPTETVYGLAGDITNLHAISQIFASKERPTFDPLIVHISLNQKGSFLTYLEEDLQLVNLSDFSASTRQKIDHLLHCFWPGPLTIVLPKTSRVADLVTSGLGDVALRIPKHPITQAVLQASQTPLAAPSANRFGRISPTSAQAVLAELAGRIPCILDGGSCQVGLESTVIRIDLQGIPWLLRPGGLASEQIAAVWGEPLHLPNSEASQGSPGRLTSHYAPQKPLLLLPKPLAHFTENDWQIWREKLDPYPHLGVLRFVQPGDAVLDLADPWRKPVTVSLLSGVEDLPAAARGLFASLRTLDESPAHIIVSEPSPSMNGLGHAIADRLQRAAVKRMI